MTLLNSHLCTKLSYFNKEYVLMKMKKMYMTHRNVFEKSEKKKEFLYRYFEPKNGLSFRRASTLWVFLREGHWLKARSARRAEKF